VDSTSSEVRCNTLRGFFYKLQSTPDLSQPFVDEPGGFTQAFDASMTRTGSLTGSSRFYRMAAALTQ
jgi:hypothetical protein